MRGEGERRLGETPAAFGAHTAINLGVLELLDAGSRASSSISAAIRRSTRLTRLMSTTMLQRSG